jgi:hypothetical protein
MLFETNAALTIKDEHSWDKENSHGNYGSRDYGN